MIIEAIGLGLLTHGLTRADAADAAAQALLLLGAVAILAGIEIRRRSKRAGKPVR